MLPRNEKKYSKNQTRFYEMIFDTSRQLYGPNLVSLVRMLFPKTPDYNGYGIGRILSLYINNVQFLLISQTKEVQTIITNQATNHFVSFLKKIYAEMHEDECDADYWQMIANTISHFIIEDLNESKIRELFESYNLYNALLAHYPYLDIWTTMRDLQRTLNLDQIAPTARRKTKRIQKEIYEATFYKYYDCTELGLVPSKYAVLLLLLTFTIWNMAYRYASTNVFIGASLFNALLIYIGIKLPGNRVLTEESQAFFYKIGIQNLKKVTDFNTKSIMNSAQRAIVIEGAIKISGCQVLSNRKFVQVDLPREQKQNKVLATYKHTYEESIPMVHELTNTQRKKLKGKKLARENQSVQVVEKQEHEKKQFQLPADFEGKLITGRNDSLFAIRIPPRSKITFAEIDEMMGDQGYIQAHQSGQSGFKMRTNHTLWAKNKNNGQRLEFEKAGSIDIKVSTSKEEVSQSVPYYEPVGWRNK